MKKIVKALSLVGVCAASLTGCGESNVSFKNDVRPILAKNCLECHQPGAAGFKKSGLAVGNYRDLMVEGTKPAGGEQRGQVIVPGDSASSTLIILVEGRADPSIRMPHDKDPLNEKDIAILKKWIDEGAKDN
uniref:Planctomycete cytochrome C n=1 Tax=Candidatus Kentrum sp. TC TaxID=2126339 RepID=A0A450YM60_9GAMM|nr:MAG: Planctomycete cytochrome C [Candidatus Kentron sp. TC]VFK62459.1 MAG: Planctomycete cytochrome C [Candidatus Kentron sp. TC]